MQMRQHRKVERMKCTICGKEASSYSMGTRRYEPCGCIDNSEQALKQSKATNEAISLMNKLYNDLVGSTRSRRSYTYWRIPRNWKGTRYQFGYTPWKTQYDGKKGFFAVKYRETKDRIKLVKTVRFGKRKTAREQSSQWHDAYYNKGSSQPT
jgi:hypothetical protein